MVKPLDINTNEHFWDTFDNMETEVSACWIVRFLQQFNDWRDFTYDEINSFYKENLKDKDAGDFTFNRLIHPGRAFTIMNGGEYYDVGGGWIQEIEPGKYRITDDFIGCVAKRAKTTGN